MLVTSIPSQFKVLLPVGQLLKESGRYKPIFYFDERIHGLKKEQATCDEMELEFIASYKQNKDISSDVPHVDLDSNLPKPAGLKELLIKFLMTTGLGQMIIYWNYLRKERRSIIRLLKQYQVELIIITTDGIPSNSSIIIKTASRLLIPSLVVPFTVSNALEPYRILRDDPHYQVNNISRKLWALILPRWVFTKNKRKVFRVKPAKAVMMDIMGLAPRKPWLAVGGSATQIAVESDYMHDHYLKEGVQENKLTLTGTPKDDVLFNSLKERNEHRNKLIEKYDLDAEKGIILCALPPLDMEFDTQLDPNYKPFDTLKELIDFWIESLTSCTSYNIIVNLHPRTVLEKVKFIEEFGVTICSWDVSELIPLSDIFVASISATIRYAVACGVPVINYDIFRANYTDYKSLKGVITIQEKDAFVNELQKLANDKDYYEDIKSAQALKMSYFAKLDGKSSERILQLIDKYA